MNCKKGKRCSNFVLSTSVTVGTGVLTVNIPNRFRNCGCLVIAQAIPDTATVNLPVVITIGTDTTAYPLIDTCGVQMSAGRLRARNPYSFKVIVGDTETVIRLCGNRCPYNVIV